MSGRRTVIGLCMLCAMAFSAIAAQAASASGTTTYTKGSETAIANGESTELTSLDGTTVFRTVSSGVTLSFQSEEVATSGFMENSESGEMGASGSGVVTYKKATVTAPAGKGCALKSGAVTTNNITGTTGKQGMFVLFTPTSGTVFAAFTMEGCSTAALNKEYKVEGAVLGVPTGTEIVFTHAETTSQGTLTFAGQKAGLSGVVSLTGRKAGSGSAYTALEGKT